MRVSPPVRPMVVQRVAVETVTLKEGGDTVGSAYWAGEKQQNSIGAGCGANNVIGCPDVMGRRCVVCIGETGCLYMCRWLRGYAGGADGYSWRRRPREASLVEVHVG
eukprot:175280-Pleurochrysis_carterae.AAC.1